jgi:pimeloyl-ACP methyl ester carboxylesterase
MQDELLTLPGSGGAVLAGERRGRPGAQAVVFLHAGVADRRSWHGVLDLLGDEDLDLVAYDRRGYGGTPLGPPSETFTHLDDLVAVLDALRIEHAVLVGNSMGGGLALDAAATAPERVAALVLLAASVSGIPEDPDEELDEATAGLVAALDEAGAAHDPEAENRLLMRLWLDGPGQQEGRVSGPARRLALEMNRIVLAGAVPEDSGMSGLDTWSRLDRIEAPALVAWGELDIPVDLRWYAATAEHLPNGSARPLPGCAHLPSLERPDLVADLVREAVRWPKKRDSAAGRDRPRC